MHYIIIEHAPAPNDLSTRAAATSKIAPQPQQVDVNATSQNCHMQLTQPTCTPHAIRVQVTCVHRKTAFTIYKMEHLQVQVATLSTADAYILKGGTYKVCLHVKCLLHGSECVLRESACMTMRVSVQ